jgi:phage protein D
MRRTGDDTAYFKIWIDGKELNELHPGAKPGSLKVEDAPKKIDNVTIDMGDIPIELVDSNWLQEDHHIKVEIGVTGQWSFDREYKIVEISYEFQLKISAKVTCAADGTTLAARKTGIVYKDKTPSEIATEIAKRYGFKTDAIYPMSTRITIAQKFRTDAELLRQMAEEFNYIFRIIGDKLVWKPVGYELPPKVEFTWIEGGRGDIKRFTGGFKSVAVKAAGDKVKTAGVDPHTGKTVTTESDQVKTTGKARTTSVVFEKGGGYSAHTQLPADQPDAPIASYGPKVVNSTPSDYSPSQGYPTTDVGTTKPGDSPTVVHDPHGDPKRAQAKATSLHQRTVWQSGSASIQLINTRVIPDQTIRLKGIGGKLSGVWYAAKVSYSISNDVMTVDVELARDAVGKKDSKKKDAPKEKTPGADAKDGAHSSSGGSGSTSDNSKSQARKTIVLYKSGGAYEAQQQYQPDAPPPTNFTNYAPAQNSTQIVNYTPGNE